MEQNGEQAESPAGSTGAAKIAAAFIGLIVAAFCLLVFIFRLSGHILMVDSDLVFFYFVACGVVAGVGLLFVYRLLPRHKPSSLVDQSGGVAIEPATTIEVPAQTAERSQNPSERAVEMPLRAEADPIRNNDRHQNVARYKTPDGGGAIGLFVMIGMAAILVVGPNFAGPFLLAIPAGGAVALGLYWARRGNLG